VYAFRVTSPISLTGVNGSMSCAPTFSVIMLKRAVCHRAAVMIKPERLFLHDLLHPIRGATFEDRVTAVHRPDVWRARGQRQGRERRRTATQ
jgi:hypothetical protein